jgi:hypothetical protein
VSTKTPARFRPPKPDSERDHIEQSQQFGISESALSAIVLVRSGGEPKAWDWHIMETFKGLITLSVVLVKMLALRKRHLNQKFKVLHPGILAVGVALARARCEMSRRDGAIVAWHEVPGTAPPQKSRPVGYGLICAGVRTDSMIGAAKFGCQKRKKCML